MKDTLLLPVTHAGAASELTTAGGSSAAANTGVNAAGSASMAGSGAEKASFHDSLKALLSSGTTLDRALAFAFEGGKDLPPAEQTAASIPPTLLSTPTDPLAQQDTVLSTGVTPGPVTPVTENTGTATAAAVLSAVSKSAQSQLSAQAASIAIHSTATDLAPQHIDRGRSAELSVTPPPSQALNKIDALISSSSPLVRMQLAPPASSQDLDPVINDIAVKAGSMPQSNTAEAANIQLALKTAGAAAESDQLFASRVQSGLLNQPGEAATQKLILESMPTQTQAASTDSLNASFTRAVIPQAMLSAEPLTTTLTQTSINETFGKADWGQGMGKQILWMVNQNISSAEFRLNPAKLGPLEVRIDMDNDQVNVAFSSRHADVREAVEQALPRLREMFEDKGLNLSDTDVSQHSFAEQRENAFEQAAEQQTGFTSGKPFTAEGDQLADDKHQAMDSMGVAARLNEGLVDYYI